MNMNKNSVRENVRTAVAIVEQKNHGGNPEPVWSHHQSGRSHEAWRRRLRRKTHRSKKIQLLCDEILSRRALILHVVVERALERNAHREARAYLKLATLATATVPSPTTGSVNYVKLKAKSETHCTITAELSMPGRPSSLAVKLWAAYNNWRPGQAVKNPARGANLCSFP